MKTIGCFLFCFLFYGLLKSEENYQKKLAIIFGVTGQDGCYLTRLLLEKKYKVIGISRTINQNNTNNLFSLLKNKAERVKNLELISGDITNFDFVLKIIQNYLPDEIYNLAAQSSVKKSFEDPIQTFNINAVGTLNILESIRKINEIKKVRFFQASTCEIFEKQNHQMLNENSPIFPTSPYGTSKAFAHFATVNYRQIFGIYACNGIMFNHESPLRGDDFVTKKIINGVNKIAKGIQEHIILGNINVMRDWGFAGDYVEAMWLMLQQKTPDDFVIATGEAHTVREFVEIVFKEFGIDIEWKDKDINEVGLNKKTGTPAIFVDSKYFRPNEILISIGDPTKAKNLLKWKQKLTFDKLIKTMIEIL